MKVLLVEDDSEKLRLVATVIHKISAGGIEIETAHNAAQAKKALSTTQYDVMILDVSLPAAADALASPKGGLDLLRAVVRTDRYLKPREIIGLTAYANLLDEVGHSFSNQLWTLVHFDRSSEEWSSQMTQKIRYLMGAAQSGSVPEYNAELCILTALYDPELKAVLRLPWSWKELEFPNDATQYWEGHYQRNGETHRVVASCATKMGMPNAATLAMKMIHSFRPKYLSMVGIAAGVRGTCSLGDVIAADPCWDWGSGKFKDVDGAAVFEAAPEQLGLDSFVKSKLKGMSQDSSRLEEVRSRWPGDGVNTVLRLHVGPLASGAAVLSDQEHTGLIKQQHRKLMGIDMEAYSIFAAAVDASRPQPTPFVIKGVVDFADKHKGDSYQAYASYASASVLQLFVENYL
jgi:nucleoside phosphorylase